MGSKLLYEDLTYAIIGAAMEVHRVLGAVFLEYVYEEALCYELTLRKISFERQKELDIFYKDHVIPKKYRPDLLLEGKVIVDNKATSDCAEARGFFIDVNLRNLGIENMVWRSAAPFNP